MRIPNALKLIPPPDTQPISSEAPHTALTPSPRYWPATEQRVMARFAPFVIQGASGSQACAILAQALINARRRGFEVIAISRDGGFTRQPVHEVDPQGRTLRTFSVSPQHHPALRIRAPGESARIPPEAKVFNSVVAPALLTTVEDLPAGTKIFTSQNGVPNTLPPEKNLQRQHSISTIATAIKDSPRRATVTRGGALYFDERTPDRDYLECVLGGGDLFALKFVPDIRVSQWRKIACNVVNNTLCTLFDTTFGGLLERTHKDPRCQALVRGMLAETLQVARARGINPGDLDELHRLVIDTQQSLPGHQSSMRHALVSGYATENAYLAAAISRESRQRGLAAPLCARAAEGIDAYIALRDSARAAHPRLFYEDNRQRVMDETEALLDIADRVFPESVTQTK